MDAVCVVSFSFLSRLFPQSLSGHKRSVRSLSFSSPSMLCSGSVSGEVRVWSVPTSTCVGCFQAHCGSTQALTFVDEGRMLLSGGSDHTVRDWSPQMKNTFAVLSVIYAPREFQCELSRYQDVRCLLSLI